MHVSCLERAGRTTGSRYHGETWRLVALEPHRKVRRQLSLAGCVPGQQGVAALDNRRVLKACGMYAVSTPPAIIQRRIPRVGRCCALAHNDDAERQKD